MVYREGIPDLLAPAGMVRVVEDETEVGKEPQLEGEKGLDAFERVVVKHGGGLEEVALEEEGHLSQV